MPVGPGVLLEDVIYVVDGTDDKADGVELASDLYSNTIR
jgi:hypothetical protein